MIDEIDRMFGTVEDYYPGSKTKRRPVNPEVAARKRLHEPEAWDARPYVKTVNGKQVEFFTIGALAIALGKSLVTIRLWTRKGYIPQAPYRLPTQIVNGRELKGRRLYTRPLIESAVEAFSKRGLIGVERVEWNHHRDLSIELLETWKRIHDEETSR